MEYIYSEEELENLSGTKLQQKAQEIKQRFDYRRSFFQTLRNNISNIEQWNELNTKLVEFEKNEYKTWSANWNNIYRTNNLNQLKSFFNNGTEIFQNFEEEVQEIKPEYLSTDEVESLKTEVLNRVDEDMITIKNEMIAQIEKGIQDLLDLKSELGLQKNFAENLKSVRTNSNKTKNLFLFGFITSLFFIAIFLVFSYNLSFIQGLESYEKILVRIGAISSLAILSYVLFQQFRLHQILHLKYTHLDNFLGGGATYISQLVSQDGELKKETNKRLTDMFMEIEDTLGNAKSIEHPTDTYGKTVDGLLKKVNELAETVKELKNPTE